MGRVFSVERNLRCPSSPVSSQRTQALRADAPTGSPGPSQVASQETATTQKPPLVRFRVLEAGGLGKPCHLRGRCHSCHLPSEKQLSARSLSSPVNAPGAAGTQWGSTVNGWHRSPLPTTTLGQPAPHLQPAAPPAAPSPSLPSHPPSLPRKPLVTKVTACHFPSLIQQVPCSQGTLWSPGKLAQHPNGQVGEGEGLQQGPVTGQGRARTLPARASQWLGHWLQS